MGRCGSGVSSVAGGRVGACEAAAAVRGAGSGLARRACWPEMVTAGRRQSMFGWCSASHGIPRMASYPPSFVTVKRQGNGHADEFVAIVQEGDAVPAAGDRDPSARRMCRASGASGMDAERAKSVSRKLVEAPLSRRMTAARPPTVPASLMRRVLSAGAVVALPRSSIRLRSTTDGGEGGGGCVGVRRGGLRGGGGGSGGGEGPASAWKLLDSSGFQTGRTSFPPVLICPPPDSCSPSPYTPPCGDPPSRI